MRVAQSFVSLAICLAPLVTPVASMAWPEAHWQAGGLIARADDTSSSSSSSSSSSDASSSTPSSNSGSTTPTGSASKSSGSTGSTVADLNTAQPSDATKTKDGDAPATRTAFGNDIAAGGVNMLTPGPFAEKTPSYKIKDKVTWGWNYTSLEGTPTAIDVIVSCSAATRTWTLTSNMTFQTSVEYVWDTKKQSDAQDPLGVALYTLIIKDSDTSITSAPEAGYLAPYKNFVFGMYTPKPATPLADFKCVGCSDAASMMDRQALSLAVTMSIISVLSFTWFVAGLGLN